MARAVIEPNFENASLEELEVAMKCAPHQPGALRLRRIWAMGSRASLLRDRLTPRTSAGGGDYALRSDRYTALTTLRIPD